MTQFNKCARILTNVVVWAILIVTSEALLWDRLARIFNAGTVVKGAGTTYYVSPSGSDSNSGSETLPFRTIQKAADVVSPGDTVIVKDGTYTGITSNRSCSAEERSHVCITRGGNSSNWVVFKAENKWGARIDGQNNTNASGFVFASSSASYVRIEGFEIFGMGRDGSAGAIESYSGANNIQIVGNHIHHIGRLCTSTSNGQVGYYGKSSNVLIEGNVFHDIGRFDENEQGCRNSNENYQNHDHGIYIDSRVNNVIIRNNVFYNIAHGWSIQLWNGTLDGVAVVNNTFSGANPYKDGQIVLWTGTHKNLTIKNNIFYQPRGSVISTNTGSVFTNAEVANNVVTVAKITNIATPAGMLLSGNRLNTDPKLMNPAALDFHLQAASPAIDSGINLGSLVPNDFDGRLRPQGNGYDIGAYEFSAARPLANVSAASYNNAVIAPDSIAAAFGSGLATTIQIASVLPLPTTLAGTRVSVRDSAGSERLAQLFFVSPTQVNYLLPAGTANGAVEITITSSDGAVSAGIMQIAAVAPGFFTVNASGQGLPAAVALRVREDGTQSIEPVGVLDPAQNKFVSRPIDLGSATDQVFLVLFGTGIRFRSNLSAVITRVGGTDSQVTYAGPSPGFAGLDQVNVRIPRSLIGRGEVDVAMTVDGKTVNTVRVNIK
jgi:uncharacterized protein (TIGR03437 family)